MRILFMGTPDFAVPTLKCLIDSGHEVIGVVTQPDKPKGRGNVMMSTPVKEVALAYDIPVFQPVRIRKDEAFKEAIAAMKPDVAIVIAFGQILPNDFLAIPKYGCLNIHASLLPKLRGSAPIQWAVINGETESGITTMQMDVGIDTGDMLLKAVTSLDKSETGGSLHDRLSLMGGPLILETLEHVEAGTLKPTPQDHEAHTYAPMLTKELGNIDWTKPANEIERLIRGLNPWPSAYTHLNGKTLKLWEAEVVDHQRGETPGAIIEIRKQDGFVVACGQNALLIKNLQLQGKNRMDAASFLRGVPVTTGTVLSK